ncbi:hypothetical protein Y032_0189g1207 [Ancylostoma ceylanicum]|uniref:Uncharacterized protein n=1 Tax=Ancylostoma ceylanicum TaxID=53326 RepID=A0A016SR73_9BILA|nr:hypothetical protein Y032_0189g1207 [Ancylostoma ceylanicum]
MDNKSPKPEARDGGDVKVTEEYVAEYYPDILSNYSNSSGTISYDTVMTPRRPEYREIRFAAEGTIPNDPCYYAREVELLPPPLKPEMVDWDLLKRLNKLLDYKERNKKTIEIQRAEKGTMEQSKQVIEQALLKFLARPTGMAMNISTVPKSRPARLAIKVEGWNMSVEATHAIRLSRVAPWQISGPALHPVAASACVRVACTKRSVCPTEHMRTASAPLLTMEALANAFHIDPNFISESELVREQTRLFRKRVEKRQEAEAKKPNRPTFPKDPPVHESRSYGPAAMAHEYHGTA